MKKKKNKVRFHPALVFLVLTFVVMIVSSVGGILNLETNYYTVNTVSGDLESTVIKINNLFNRTGLQYLFSNFLTNFTSFTPLGTLILGLMGIGVAYKSGFLNTLNKVIVRYVPKRLLTFLIVFLGVVLTFVCDVGYVILIPLAAILFMSMGRNPLAGICAAFAGVTFGSGAGLFAGNLDSNILPYTKSATRILDATYKVNTNGNLFFMIVSTLLVSFVGYIVTEKVVIPMLGKYSYTEDEISDIKTDPSKTEIKGLIISLLSICIILIPIIYCIIPGLPFSGLLLYLKDKGYVNQMFGDNSYFYQGSVFLFSLLLMIAGLIYGLRVKTFNNNRDFVDGMNYYLKDLSSLIVLIFFASQFCLIFRETNIGDFLLAIFTNFIGDFEATGIVLVIITFILVLVSSLLMPMAARKWAIISPILVPMYMESSLTPEFAQAVFRAANSTVCGVTPLFTYFVILIGFLQIYNRNKEETITISKSLKLMMPYSLAFTVLWFTIVLIFYFLGIPIGIGTSVTL